MTTTDPTATATQAAAPLERERLDAERHVLLQRLQGWLETPMIVLAFVWLGLLVAELVWGLTPFLEAAGYVVWAIFIVEFVIGWFVAPAKLGYLKSNWLKAISLVVPALRGLRLLAVFRVARAARFARVAGGARGVLRIVSAANRGMHAFQKSMRRRGFGYVVGSTLIVTLAGAAGMYAFERQGGGSGFESYGSALWWTAMIMTTMGSQAWPQTGAGRALCLLLSLYAFAVFGYVAATLATYFIGRDADDDDAEVAGAKAIAELRSEIAALRAELAQPR